MESQMQRQYAVRVTQPQGLLPEVEAIAELLRMGPDLHAADILLNHRFFDDFIIVCKGLARQAPTSSVYARLAHAQYCNGNMREAHMSACVAVAMDCANAMALAIRARCRVVAKDYIGAKADLDLMPSHDEVLREAVILCDHEVAIFHVDQEVVQKQNPKCKTSQHTERLLAAQAASEQIMTKATQLAEVFLRTFAREHCLEQQAPNTLLGSDLASATASGNKYEVLLSQTKSAAVVSEVRLFPNAVMQVTLPDPLGSGQHKMASKGVMVYSRNGLSSPAPQANSSKSSAAAANMPLVDTAEADLAQSAEADPAQSAESVQKPSTLAEADHTQSAELAQKPTTLAEADHRQSAESAQKPLSDAIDSSLSQIENSANQPPDTKAAEVLGSAETATVFQKASSTLANAIHSKQWSAHSRAPVSNVNLGTLKKVPRHGVNAAPSILLKDLQEKQSKDDAIRSGLWKVLDGPNAFRHPQQLGLVPIESPAIAQASQRQIQDKTLSALLTTPQGSAKLIGVGYPQTEALHDAVADAALIGHRSPITEPLQSSKPASLRSVSQVLAVKSAENASSGSKNTPHAPQMDKTLLRQMLSNSIQLLSQKDKMMGERQDSQLSPAEILDECEAVDAQHRANMKRLFPNEDVSKMTLTQDVRAALGDTAALPQAKLKSMPATAQSVRGCQASRRPRLSQRPVATVTKQGKKGEGTGLHIAQCAGDQQHLPAGSQRQTAVGSQASADQMPCLRPPLPARPRQKTRAHTPQQPQEAQTSAADSQHAQQAQHSHQNAASQAEDTPPAEQTAAQAAARALAHEPAHVQAAVWKSWAAGGAKEREQVKRSNFLPQQVMNKMRSASLQAEQAKQYSQGSRSAIGNQY